MDQRKTVAVIGGDQRLIYTKQRFETMGYAVRAFALTEGTCPLAQAFAADIIIFGVPFSKDGETVFAPLSDQKIRIRDVCVGLSGRNTVFAGMLSAKEMQALTATGAAVTDYMKDAVLTQKNADLTAEILTGQLILLLPCALSGAEIAVAGYGRIGAALAHKLTLLGANVTVFARGEAARAQALASGCKALPFSALEDRCGRYRAFVNTVPAQILDPQALGNLPLDCVLIEAASAPYGINDAAAKEMGFSYTLASGLPGKYAPETAGAWIADTAIRLFREVREHGTA